MGAIRKLYNKANVSEIYVQKDFHCRSRHITIKNIDIVMAFIVLFLKGWIKRAIFLFHNALESITNCNVNRIE